MSARILVCVPDEHESADLVRLLVAEGYLVEPYSHLSELAAQLDNNVSALVIGEAALAIDDCSLPCGWSRWPVLLLAESRDGRGQDAERAWRKVSAVVDKVQIEERPLSPRSLLCSLATLLRLGAQHQAPTQTRDMDNAVQVQKLEALGQLTGCIAHDFNNMLTGVIGALDLIKVRIASGRVDALERLVETASISANRAAALTQRLLVFSRRRPLNLHLVDLHALLPDIELALGQAVGERYQLISHRQPGQAWVMADADELKNSLLALALNARDAMPGGGQLRLDTERVDVAQLPPLPAAELRPGAYLLLRFSDSGMGMDAQVLSRAFDPFFTTKPVGQGSGLGLSMVHGFARQSGGQVVIDSQPGVGTRVALYLPVAAAPEPPVLQAEEPVIDDSDGPAPPMRLRTSAPTRVRPKSMKSGLKIMSRF